MQENLSLLMRARVPFPHRNRPFILGLLYALFHVCSAAHAQGSTDHLPGKMYVIRVTSLITDSVAMEGVLKDRIDPVLAKPMFGYIHEHLHRMRAAADGRWFVGYFHPDRQDRDALMRDNDLLIWLFHGHDVQIMPIELVRSPIPTPTLGASGR